MSMATRLSPMRLTWLVKLTLELAVNEIAERPPDISTEQWLNSMLK